MYNSENNKRSSTVKDQIDFEGLIKALQLISSETDLDKLQIATMEFGLAKSEANKTAIILKNNEIWSIQALVGKNEKKTLLNQSFDPKNFSSNIIPKAIFNYCQKFKEKLVVENAELDERFYKDKLIQKNKIKSIVCIPIISQEELIAMMYLENCELENVFNSKQIQFLKHLSNQFGISVKNALQYQNFNQKILELRESELRFRYIFENANESIVVVQDEVIKYFNPQLKELTGFSKEEINSKNFAQFVEPEDLEKVNNEYQLKISRKKKRSSYTARVLTKGGAAKFVLVNSMSINWGGRPAALAMATDITKLKKTELELKRSEECFRHLIEQSPLAIEILSPNGKIRIVNRSWKKLWRVNDEEAEEVIAKYNMLTDPQIEKLGILDKVKEAFKGNHVILPPIQYETGQTANDFDLSHIEEHKSPWIQCHLNSVKDEKGDIDFIVNTYVDITDLNEAMARAQKNEMFFRNLMEFSPLSIAIFRSNGELMQVNTAWRELWGISKEETSQIMEKYNFRKDKQIVALGYGPLLERAFNGEHVILPILDYKGGTTVENVGLKDVEARTRTIQTHIYSVKDANGKIDYVVNIIMDLTELKKVEKESNRQQKILAQVNRSKRMGLLTASIAHELNQPLTGILSNAQASELLLKNKNWDKEEHKEILSDIISDTKRAGDLIRNLRGLFQNKKVEFSSIEINSIIKEIKEILHSEIVMKNVEVTTKYASLPPNLNGNKVQIQQVLVNLIMNAIQAVDYKNREDRKLLITSSYDENEIKVSVEDNGKGINADIIGRIFEPLATWKSDGTGMGLAISNIIISAHGGEMFAENRVNGGAIVGFTVPTIKENE